MRASRELRVIHSRGGGFLQANRVDTVEVVEIASGEVVLYWDVRARDVRRFLAALREELNASELEDFLARWSAVEGPADL